MNRATLLLLLALPAASLAQTPAPTTQQPTPNPATEAILRGRLALIEHSLESACPIGLSAEPGVNPGMLIVVNGDTTAAQKLKLQLRHLTGPHSHPSAITAARITVHGLTAKGRIAPASSNPDADTIAKQVNLALTIAPNHTTSTDMLFQGFTSIRWITLDSLTYADGTTWHPAAHKSCSIVPNRFMAVAAAR